MLYVQEDAAAVGAATAVLPRVLAEDQEKRGTWVAP